MKIKASSQCSYCDGIDDISHFFFHCANVHYLWNQFFALWNEVEYYKVNFPNYPNAKDILFGITNAHNGNEVMNFCVIHVKFYIYKRRLFSDNMMTLRELCNELLFKLEVEKQILAKEDRLVHFDKYLPLYNKLKTH